MTGEQDVLFGEPEWVQDQLDFTELDDPSITNEGDIDPRARLGIQSLGSIL